MSGHGSERKWIRVVRRMLMGPCTRFQAEHWPTSDHCLPSTIAELRKRYGLEIHAETIVVPGFEGSPTRVSSYSLSPTSRKRALELITAQGSRVE